MQARKLAESDVLFWGARTTRRGMSLARISYIRCRVVCNGKKENLDRCRNDAEAMQKRARSHSTHGMPEKRANLRSS